MFLFPPPILTSPIRGSYVWLMSRLYHMIQQVGVLLPTYLSSESKTRELFKGEQSERGDICDTFKVNECRTIQQSDRLNHAD